MVKRHTTRALLHRNKLADFKKWILDGRGYFEKPPSGHEYEVFRFSKYTPQGDNPDIVFYQKIRYQHVTLDEDGERLVKQWLRERKDAEKNRRLAKT